MLLSFIPFQFYFNEKSKIDIHIGTLKKIYGDEIHQLKQEIIKLKRDLLEAITICEKKKFY